MEEATNIDVLGRGAAVSCTEDQALTKHQGLSCEQREAPGIDGLRNSNIDFSSDDSYGRNTMLSAIPTALLIYMNNKGLKVPTICCAADALSTFVEERRASEVLGMDPSGDNFRVEFEVPFDDQKWFDDAHQNMDVVIIDTAVYRHVASVEMKTTVFPCNATARLEIGRQGCELIIRPNTIYKLAIRILSALRTMWNTTQTRAWFADRLMTHGLMTADLTDGSCVKDYQKGMVRIIEDVLRLDFEQKAVLFQMIWQTEGKRHRLADFCWDGYAWSDKALLRFIADFSGSGLSVPVEGPGPEMAAPSVSKARMARVPTTSVQGANSGANSGASPGGPAGLTSINRPERALMNLVAMLRNYAVTGKCQSEKVFSEIVFETKNDKAIGANGSVTRRYMTGPWLANPRIRRSEIPQVIGKRAAEALRPARDLLSLTMLAVAEENDGGDGIDTTGAAGNGSYAELSDDELRNRMQCLQREIERRDLGQQAATDQHENKGFMPAATEAIAEGTGSEQFVIADIFEANAKT